MSWTKLGSTSQLVPIPRRGTTWPVLPSVIGGNVGAPATRERSAEAIAAPAPVAAAVLRKRLRLPPHVPWDPSIVTTFPLMSSRDPGSARSPRGSVVRGEWPLFWPERPRVVNNLSTFCPYPADGTPIGRRQRNG